VREDAALGALLLILRRLRLDHAMEEPGSGDGVMEAE
jgi:hypothetical protein